MSSSPLVDTHSHLDDPAFDADRAEVVQRAADVGVRDIVIIGYRPDGWERAIRTAQAFSGGHVALGIHPQDADTFDEVSRRQLRRLLVDVQAVAVGETGIDLFRDNPPLPVQQEAFAAQLALAQELSLPTIIHQRAAEAETLAILERTPAGQMIVLHSFDAGHDTAKLARKRGWMLGVGGLMTRQSATTVRDILTDFPLDQLLLETDAPYLMPSRLKGHRNEPAHLAVIQDRLAELRGVSAGDIARRTTANAARVFGLAHA